MGVARHRGFRAARTQLHRVELSGWSGRTRLAHLTDLHFGTVTPVSLLEDAVDAANAARPDHVVLTGDFVCRGVGYLGRLTATLERLEAPAWAVIGNHDHWSGADRVRDALREAGIDVLDNGWRWLDTHGEPLRLVGLDDVGTGNHCVQTATRDLPPGPAVGLSHNPEGAPLLWEHGVQVVLSGHTHGGHVHMGRVTEELFQRVLGTRFVGGWYHQGDHRVYVNPGVGSGAFPWRLGRPAQRAVAVLDVVGRT